MTIAKYPIYGNWRKWVNKMVSYIGREYYLCIQLYLDWRGPSYTGLTARVLSDCCWGWETSATHLFSVVAHSPKPNQMAEAEAIVSLMLFYAIWLTPSVSLLNVFHYNYDLIDIHDLHNLYDLHKITAQDLQMK